MTHNRSSGLTHEELLERAAAAIVREWGPGGRVGGVTIEEAHAAVERNFASQDRLGVELAAAGADWTIPEQRPAAVDLTTVETEPACS